jgi:hypothetical protein
MFNTSISDMSRRLVRRPVAGQGLRAAFASVR